MSMLSKWAGALAGASQVFAISMFAQAPASA